MRNILLVLASGLLFSCSSSKKSAVAHTNNSANVPQSTTIIGPAKVTTMGSSYSNAIVINETNGLKGVDAEYDWIKKNYADYIIDGQSEKELNGKHYDVIKISMSNGQKSDVYFDISKFYGK